MPGPFDDKRNPLILPPAGEPNRARCPHCGSYDFAGRNVQGVITFTCTKCKGMWQGGLPQTPQDPRIPLPPESYVPTVRFVKDSKGGDLEIRRRVDTRTDFRKGALIPEGDE